MDVVGKELPKKALAGGETMPSRAAGTETKKGKCDEALVFKVKFGYNRRYISFLHKRLNPEEV